MKKFYIFIAAAALLALSACNALDMAPVDYSAAGSYWKTEAQVQNYQNNLMVKLRSCYLKPFYLGELRGGTFKAGTSIENQSLNDDQIVQNRLDRDNTGVSGWGGGGLYGLIFHCNHFIDQLENACSFLDDASRSKYLATGYGIRAWCYFMLYRTYGGVPMELEPRVIQANVDLNNLGLPRTSAEGTLAQIKKDIDHSEELYGSDRSLDRYMWNYYATEMLKAQVYLWSAKVTTNFSDEAGKHTATGSTEELNKAKGALENIVNSGKFSLLDNFADVFSYNNKGNNEVILEIFFLNGEATNSFNQFIYQAAIWCNSYYDENGNLLDDPLDLRNTGMHRYEWKESLVKSFDKNDARRAATFHECYANADATGFGSAMIKYMGHAEGSTRYYDSDFILYRYADVILTLAEIENALDNPTAAAGYISDIRRRAYGNDSHKFEAASKAETELAILKERDKEFVGEGTRWFDLIRLQDASGKPLAFSADAAYATTYGSAATAVLSSNEEHKLLWPIDASTWTNDKLLEQTWGYEGFKEE